MAKAQRSPKSSDIGARDRLLVAAAELFSRKGYAATTTREIVASAGVTKPVLYYYFQNKEGIYLELMRKALAGFEEVVNACLTGAGTARERLLSICDQVFALFMDHIEVVRLMYSIYYGPPQGAPFFDFDAPHLKLQETMMQLVDEGIRKREFREGARQDMTWAILGSVNIAMEVELCHPERRMGREGLARVLALILEGLSTHQATEKGE